MQNKKMGGVTLDKVLERTTQALEKRGYATIAERSQNAGIIGFDVEEKIAAKHGAERALYASAVVRRVLHPQPPLLVLTDWPQPVQQEDDVVLQKIDQLIQKQTEMFYEEGNALGLKCSCGSKEFSFHTEQRRAADEGATELATCNTCQKVLIVFS